MKGRQISQNVATSFSSKGLKKKRKVKTISQCDLQDVLLNAGERAKTRKMLMI